ncbi:MAG: AraC family ligand binding domain-containing protein [Gaiellaceae bacterium]
MRHWKLEDVETPEGSRSPAVLHSQNGESRVVLIALHPGQALGEHQVREAALVLVVDGQVRVEAGDESVDAGPGSLFHFEPDERHAIASDAGGRILVMLAPWPGEGHYGAAAAAGAPVSAS